MVTADKRAAVEFSLAEQRALMRAAATESAPPAANCARTTSTPFGDRANGPAPLSSLRLAARTNVSGFMTKPYPDEGSLPTSSGL